MQEETIQTLAWVIGIIITSGIIEVSPLKINPWSWLFAPLRKALTSKVSDEIKQLSGQIINVRAEVAEVKDDLTKHIKKSGEEAATNARNRILRFSDEIICHQEHTKEHYRDVITTIDEYEKYCEEHPDFKNNRCVMACQNIKETYLEKCKDNSFVINERLVIAIDNRSEEIKDKQ